MLRNKECPNKSCGNPFPKMASDKSFYCPECGCQWSDTPIKPEELDRQILDHADEIIRLMKLKGFRDDSDGISYEKIHIWLKGEIIEVEDDSCLIKTIERKKK